MWNVKVKVILVITGAAGTISKSLIQCLSNTPGKHEIKQLQKISAILGTAHLLPEVQILKYEIYFAGEITLHVTRFANTEHL